MTQIALTPRTPNVLQLNDQVTFSFSYNTTEAGGVRIFARPFTNGGLTPNYAAHGSGVYPVGSGSGTGFFTITSGASPSTSIRFQMWDVRQTTLLYQGFIPVHYRFTGAVSTVVTARAGPDAERVRAEGDGYGSFSSDHRVWRGADLVRPWRTAG